MKKLTLMLLMLIMVSSATVVATAEKEKLKGVNGIYSISNFLVMNENANKQATLLVLKEGTDLSDMTEDDILYIDQVLANELGQVNFSNFQLREESNANIYIGGETLEVPKNPYFIDVEPAEFEEINIPTITQEQVKTDFNTSVTVLNQTREEVEIETGGKYCVIFGEINNDYNGWELTEWGVDLLSIEDDSLIEECSADKVIELTEKGKFGIMLYGPGLKEDEYSVRVYAKYMQIGSDGTSQKVIGNKVDLTFAL